MRVALRSFGMTEEAPLERHQVSRQMMKLRPRRLREEAGVNQEVALGAQLGRDPRMRLRRAGEALRQREMRVRDRGKQAKRTLGDGGQPRARSLRGSGSSPMNARSTTPSITSAKSVGVATVALSCNAVCAKPGAPFS